VFGRLAGHHPAENPGGGRPSPRLRRQAGFRPSGDHRCSIRAARLFPGRTSASVEATSVLTSVLYPVRRPHRHGHLWAAGEAPIEGFPPAILSDCIAVFLHGLRGIVLYALSWLHACICGHLSTTLRIHQVRVISWGSLSARATWGRFWGAGIICLKAASARTPVPAFARGGRHAWG